jgi:zeaxanthin glucosyltransferase
MSTVILWMLYEEGHIYPSFRIADSLKSSGVRVRYCTIPDFAQFIERHGFEVFTVMEEDHPPGWLPHMRRHAPGEIVDRVGDAYLESLLDGRVDAYLQKLSPDLLLCDTILSHLGMAAWKHRIPCARVSTALSQARAPGIPPLTSDLPFGDTPERAGAVARAWDALRREQLASPSFLAARETEVRVARRHDYPDAWIDWDTPFSPGLKRVPELVLCSPALDFPRPADDLRIAAESLWLERPPVPFPWERLRDDAPIIYCSLGSQAHRVSGSHGFLAQVIEVARRRPDWQIVVALGERLLPGDFTDVPENAVLVTFAPQLALLERSRLAITHGGLGTLKESIAFGVPMLVVPLMFDQPGNAARVEHHGVGMRGDFATLGAAELAHMAERIMGDERMARRLSAMRASFLELEARQPGLRLVQAMLAGRHSFEPQG